MTSPPPSSWRFVAVGIRRRAALLGAAALLALTACGGDDDGATWAAGWAAAPQDFMEPIPLPGRAQPVTTTLADQTVRQLVRPTVGGDALRVKLSNRFGTAPVTVSAASIGRSTGNGAVAPGSLVALVFGGAPSVTIAAGAEVWSDGVATPVSAHVDYALSLYFAGVTPYGTVHRTTFRTGWVIAGNAASATAPTVQSPLPATAQMVLASRVDVLSPHRPAVLATFGDSITDGTSSTLDALARYPDQLAGRLAARGVGVLNLGIAGNRVLHDKLGQRGVDRFARDVLDQSGVTHTLILLGINDIGFGLLTGAPFDLLPASEVVSADQIIAGLTQMVSQAKARGVKVMLGTLLPFKGAAYYSDAHNAKREAVNSWIRAQASNVHAIVDFDVAMRSANDPLAMNPAYDSGDHLHPNDAGYAAMAAAVPLDKLD